MTARQTDGGAGDARSRVDFDAVGHYARPELVVDGRLMPAVVQLASE
jgi:hypothetical protein